MPFILVAFLKGEYYEKTYLSVCRSNDFIHIGRM